MAAPSPELSPLQKQLLILLADGAESSLLVVELLNDQRTHRAHLPVRPSYSEEEVVPVLRDLVGMGLASRSTQVISPGTAPVGGVPEFHEGRSSILWWSLSKRGREVALNALSG